MDIILENLTIEVLKGHRVHCTYTVNDLLDSHSKKCPLIVKIFVKVTVQFETEGNGQNEIVSHMDR